MTQFTKGMIIKMSGLSVKKENGVFEIENCWEKDCSVYKLKKDGTRIKNGLDIFRYTKIEQYGEIITLDQVSAAISEINKQLKNRKENEIVISFESTTNKEYTNKSYIRVIQSIQTTSSIYAIPRNNVFQLSIIGTSTNVVWKRVGKRGELLSNYDGTNTMCWSEKSMSELIEKGYIEIVERVETVRKDMEQNEESENVEETPANEVIEVVEEVQETEENTINQTNEITYQTGTGTKGNGIEITFTDKPSEEVRNAMKANGYRWGGKQRSNIWWAILTDESLSLAESLAGETTQETTPEVEENVINETVELLEVAKNAQILITESNMIDRKVFGQWGVMSGWDNGIIIAETIYNEVIIKWENGYQEYFNIKDLVFVHENTNMDAVGVYLLPIETNENNNQVEVNEQVETVEEATNNVEYNSNGQIKVKSIQFIWSESGEIVDGQTVNTFEEAENLIKKAAFHAPDNGCYDKTKFNIVWSDGNDYTGRIDIVKAGSFKSAPLKNHIVSFANHVINDNESDWYTQEQKDSYKSFLETYSLEDNKQPMNVSKPAKVLDFSAKFKQRQEQNETAKAMDYFINEILPYLSLEDKIKITEVSGNAEQFQSLMYDLMIKAKRERIKQN